jgi:hypothetical protein
MCLYAPGAARTLSQNLLSINRPSAASIAFFLHFGNGKSRLRFAAVGQKQAADCPGESAPTSLPISVGLEDGGVSWTPKMRQVAKVEPCP